jgi:GNAT superfamily N-acetyltransferase
MQIQYAETDTDILRCWKAMQALRPHLVETEFVQLIKNMQAEGYRLAFIAEDGDALAVIGYRYLQFTFNGRHFYIDDLSTLPEARGKGYGGALLDHVEALARENGFGCITLDSGYQRNDAHRLYLNKGFVLASHHFSKKLS